MRVVWEQYSGVEEAAKEDNDETMDTEDDLSQDSQDSESKEKKPYNKQKPRVTTVKDRAARHERTLLLRKERQVMKTLRKESHKPRPIWINVDHPGLEASVEMMVLADACRKTVSIEWRESNLQALYRMCQNDISRGEKREPLRKGAKCGGAAGSGFVLKKTKGLRRWMAKGAIANERHLPSHPPTHPPIHPPLHTHAHHKREKII